MTIQVEDPALTEEREFILDQMQILRDDIASINLQLARIVNADPDWRRRALRAIKIKERQIQEFRIDLDGIDQEINFIVVARERLDPQLYDEIWQTVRSRQAKAHEHG
jgi:hypothetical protein